MSDYLWDKTGTPDAEVERLEQLLGTLRYQLPPLALPFNAPTPRHAAHFLHTRAHLAVAASLLFVLLAGVWLVLLRRQPPERRPVIAQATTETGSSHGSSNMSMSTDSASKNTKQDKAPLPTIRQANELTPGRIVNVALGQPQPRGVAVNVGHGARRQSLVLPHVALRGVSDASALMAEVKGVPTATDVQAAETITAEQRYATDQLMLALRVASAKLSYAQRQVQELESRDGARWK